MNRILLIVAVVLFVFAAFGADLPGRFELVPLGLAFFAAAFAVGGDRA